MVYFDSDSKNESKMSIKYVLDTNPIPPLILIEPFLHHLPIVQHLAHLDPRDGQLDLPLNNLFHPL